MWYHQLALVGFDQMRLLFSDTDSFLISVQNTFSEIESKLLEHNNVLYRKSTMIAQNRRRVGLLKLETADKQIRGFDCLQTKCYSLLLDNGEEDVKGKGIPKAYIKNS